MDSSFQKFKLFFFGNCILILFCSKIFAQNPNPDFFTHISLTGLYSHYGNNVHHTTKTLGTFAYAVAVREQWLFSQPISLVSGAEFFSHGIKFNSYYFSSGQTEIYNKRFTNKYKVNLYEINVPILLRADLQGKKRGTAVPYFEIGPTLRYLISSNINVTDSVGNERVNKSSTINFEYPLIKKNISMFMQFNTGVNFYSGDALSGFFMELNFRFAPIRFLIDESFTPNSLYINNFHLGLSLGFRI